MEVPGNVWSQSTCGLLLGMSGHDPKSSFWNMDARVMDTIPREKLVADSILGMFIDLG